MSQTILELLVTLKIKLTTWCYSGFIRFRSHNLLALWMMKFDYNKYEYNLAFLCAAKTFQGAHAIWSNSNRPLPNDSRQEIRPPHLKVVASDMRA